jgi:hypothetical protein
MLRLVPSLSPDAGGYVSSAMAEDEPELPPDRAALAEQIVRSAWRDLPAYDRELLQNIGASQWQVTTHDLGLVVDDRTRQPPAPRRFFQCPTRP